jgi:hypothetical protein
MARGSSPYKALVHFCEENNVCLVSLRRSRVLTSKGGIIDKDEEMVKARLAFVINAIASTRAPLVRIRLLADP